MSSQQIAWVQDALAHLEVVRNDLDAVIGNFSASPSSAEQAVKTQAEQTQSVVLNARSSLQSTLSGLQSLEAPPPPPPPPPAPPPPPPPPKIGLWGDSITAGSNLGPRVAPCAVSNNGVAGTNLSDASAIVAAQVAASDVNIAICRYGINDIIFAKPVQSFLNGLIAFNAAARNAGKIPVFTNLTRFSGGFPGFNMGMIVTWQNYNALIAQSAANLGAPFINITDGVYASVFPPPGDTPDGLHPNQGYYDRIDDYIAQQLRAQGLIPA